MTQQRTGRQRRSKWQVAAAKKYPRMYFLGGDGGEYECWIVLTKCPHEQVRAWRYVLCPNQSAAEALLAKWNAERCGYKCQGQAQHSLWRFYVE